MTSNYLDDVLQKHQLLGFLAKEAEILLSFIRSLGFKVNLEKSELVPSQTVVHLGMRFQKHLNRVSLTSKRIQVILDAVQVAQKSVSVIQTVPASSRLIQCSSRSAQTGSGISETAVVCIGRTVDATTGNLEDQVPVTAEIAQALDKWTDRYGWRKAFLYGHSQHRCLSAQIQVFLAGVHTCYHCFVWHRVLGLVQKEITTWQEMMAVWKALQQWELELQGKAVIILSENTSAVLCSKNQGGTQCLIGSHMSSLALVQQPQHGAEDPAYSEASQCLGRLIVKEQADNTHRMVPTSNSVRETYTGLRKSTRGSV